MRKGRARRTVATGSGAGGWLLNHLLSSHPFDPGFLTKDQYQSPGDIVVGGSPSETMLMEGMEYTTPVRLPGSATNGLTPVYNSAGDPPISWTTHGATAHSAFTRSIFLTAAHQAGNAGDGGSLTLVGNAFPQKVPVWALADAATQGFVEAFMMPADAKSATAITATIYWTPGATDATPHTVQWSFEAMVRNSGDTIDAAGTTTTFTGSSAARTLKVIVVEAAQTILASTSANDFIRLNLRRIGADAADTYVGVVNVHGIRIDYTSTA